MIRYCTRCVMPETKPDLSFDENGVCTGCRYFDQRPTVDWAQRHAELEEILARHTSKDGSRHDCIIPVSGGKDSTYQVLKILELGLNPLCVTSTTDHLSEIGRRNLDNLQRLGVDHVEVTPNPVVRRRMNRLALEQVGDISWAEHVSIFTIPVRMAVQTEVPLLVWGENSQNEYGGPAADAENSTLTRRWLEEFGGLLGLRVSDLVGTDGIQARDLIWYRYPSDADLRRVGVTGIFLGHYLPWDGYSNALLAQGHGFEAHPTTVEGSIVNYENLDNHQTGIHDYFKFLKYGFGRATDIACLHLRRGRLTRGEALALVRRHDGRFPWTYLGKALGEILEPLKMTVDEFVVVCDRFTNKRIFKTDSAGRLIKDDEGNLSKINDDNVERIDVISAPKGEQRLVRP